MLYGRGNIKGKKVVELIRVVEQAQLCVIKLPNDLREWMISRSHTKGGQGAALSGRVYDLHTLDFEI